MYFYVSLSTVCLFKIFLQALNAIYTETWQYIINCDYLLRMGSMVFLFPKDVISMNASLFLINKNKREALDFVLRFLDRWYC